MTLGVAALVLVVIVTGIVVLTRGGGSSPDDLAADAPSAEDLADDPATTDGPSTAEDEATTTTEATTDAQATIPGLGQGEFPEDAVTDDTLSPPGEDWAVGRPDITYEAFHAALASVFREDLVTCVLTSIFEQVDQQTINRYAYAPGPEYLTPQEIRIWTDTWAGCGAMVGAGG